MSNFKKFTKDQLIAKLKNSNLKLNRTNENIIKIIYNEKLK